MKIILKTVGMFLFLSIFSVTFFSCNKTNTTELSSQDTFLQYKEALETQVLTPEQKYSVLNKMTSFLLDQKNYQDLIILTTKWVDENPDDIYNSWWLLQTAHAYLSLNSEPVAEYYFDRILHTCPDLYVEGKSIHFICLQNLIQISKTPSHRIKYFNELITRFPQNINTTELYLRLAIEYENDYQWDKALKTYALFIQQPDATTIQIAGVPDAYKKARQLIDFNSSSKDWTFETLNGLTKAVQTAIKNYDAWTLDKYKAKVNFFTMSWNKDENYTDSQDDFSMANWMYGNSIRFSPTLDESSSSNEAYLKTWGWNDYVSTWYFYFRKIDFPLNPEINGNWEWAGIYIGNKL